MLYINCISIKLGEKSTYTNNHKLCGLKQYQLKCIILPFRCSEVHVDITGLNSKCPQGCFSSGGFRGDLDIPRPCVSQIPAANCIPWLAVPFLHFQSQHCISLTIPLVTTPSDFRCLPASPTLKNTCDYFGPTWVLYSKVRGLAKWIASDTLIPFCHVT